MRTIRAFLWTISVSQMYMRTLKERNDRRNLEENNRWKKKEKGVREERGAKIRKESQKLLIFFPHDKIVTQNGKGKKCSLWEWSRWSKIWLKEVVVQILCFILHKVNSPGRELCSGILIRISYNEPKKHVPNNLDFWSFMWLLACRELLLFPWLH